jgi:hypothetical protein
MISYDLKVHVGKNEREDGIQCDAWFCPIALAVQKAVKRRFRRWKNVGVSVVSHHISIAYHTNAHPTRRFVSSVPGPEVSQFINAFDMGRGKIPETLDLTLKLLVPGV